LAAFPADDQPRFPGFGEVRRDGSRAAWENFDNQTLKTSEFPMKPSMQESHKTGAQGSAIALEPYSR
jgi:hypothetical protein